MAKRKTVDAIYLCGGDTRPGPRGTDCPDPLHDHPLPAGYVDASEMAAHRLYKRWQNVKCRKCGIYGWVPPLQTSPAEAGYQTPINDERMHE